MVNFSHLFLRLFHLVEQNMSITIETTKKQLNEQLCLHYLPAKVDGDGAALNVEAAFNSYTRVESGHLTNALRGFPLQGEELTVPKDYKGVVLQETRKPLDESAERTFKMTGVFDKFTYWNYDKVPSKADAYKLALQHLQVAEELAIPITEDEVLKEIEQRKQTLQAKQLKE